MSIVSNSSIAAMWPRPLRVEYMDGRNWLLLADFEFRNPSAHFPSLIIPAGFVTDFASIPRPLWNIIHPTDERIGRMAVVHDLFYRTPSVAIEKGQADKLLRDGMKVLGADWFVRNSVWLGVKVGGTHSYKPRIAA